MKHMLTVNRDCLFHLEERACYCTVGVDGVPRPLINGEIKGGS
jgi:hypothetical protein